MMKSCTKIVVPGMMKIRIGRANVLALVMFKDGKNKTEGVNLVIDGSR